MRFLLDTHTLLWWLSNDDQLGRPIRDLIADPAHDVLVSVVSLWEIQVKVRIGKLEADLEDILHETKRRPLTRSRSARRICYAWVRSRRITQTRSTTCSSPKPSPTT